MNVHWADLADGRTHCRLFMVVLELYCDEPPERHCAVPPDPEHLTVCELAHHKFRSTHAVSLPPKEALS